MTQTTNTMEKERVVTNSYIIDNRLLDEVIKNCDQNLDIHARNMDAGGGYTEYNVFTRQDRTDDLLPYEGKLEFQNKPIQSPNDINGLTDEAVLACVLHRLRGYQEGPFSCDENQWALYHVFHALKKMRERAADRIARGVEGKNEK